MCICLSTTKQIETVTLQIQSLLLYKATTLLRFDEPHKKQIARLRSQNEKIISFYLTVSFCQRYFKHDFEQFEAVDDQRKMRTNLLRLEIRGSIHET